jgi:hypothetical protein
MPQARGDFGGREIERDGAGRELVESRHAVGILQKAVLFKRKLPGYVATTAIRMKLIALVTLLAVPVFAQDAKPDANPAPPKVAEPAPPPPAKPPELPPLPAPSGENENTDLLKVPAGGRLRPAPDRPKSLLPEGLAPSRKGDPVRPGMPPKGRSTLTPPTTSVELDARIRYRQAQSRAVNDAAVQSLWADSRAAKTDFEKREALKSYYTLLFRKMVALDKGIATLVEERKRVALRRLDQTRIEPTDPLEEEHRQRRD